MSVINVTDTINLVTWNPVTGAVSYTIEYRITGSALWTRRTSSTVSLTITGIVPGVSYEYKIQAICSSTDSSGYSNVLYTYPTAVGNLFSGSDDINSLVIYPNPITNEAILYYSLSAEENVDIKICNILGQEIQNLTFDKKMPTGKHQNIIAIPLPGVYFVKFSIGQLTVTRKVIKL